jgi:hypothetical protein
MPVVKASWHGWSIGNQAIFAKPLPGDEEGRVGLYVQLDRSTACIGVFTSVDWATFFSDWMDFALTQTGEANAELLRRLEDEQPLAFAAPPEDEEDIDASTA